MLFHHFFKCMHAIDGIEINDSSNNTSFNYSSKEYFFTLSATAQSNSVGTDQVITTPQPTDSIDIGKILGQLKELVKHLLGSLGAGCALLAERIWKRIRKPRDGRPPDYNDVPWWIRFSSFAIFGTLS